MTSTGKPAEPLPDEPPALLLRCLQHVARRFDRPTSEVVLTAGAALDEKGGLAFAEAEACLHRVGLKTRHLRVKLDRLRPGDLPTIVELQDGDSAVVLSVDPATVEIYDPFTDREGAVDRAELAGRLTGRGLAVTADPRLEASDAVADLPQIKSHWFWDEVRKYAPSFAYVGLAAAVVNLLAFAMPLFMMNVYDRIIPNQAAASLWVLAFGVVLAFGFDFLLRTARAFLVDDLGREVDAKLSAKLFEKILNTPLTHRALSTGAFARRLNDYESVRDFFTSTTVVLIVDLAFVFLFLTFMLVVGGPLVFIPLAGIAVIVFAGWSLQKLMTDALKEAQADAALHHSLLIETLGSIEAVKALRGEGRMLGKWSRHAAQSSVTQERLRRLSSLSVNLASLVQQAIAVGLIIGGFYRFTAGDMTMGAIIAIVMLSSRALAPVGQLAFLMTRGRQALLSLETLQRVMDAPDERTDASRSVVRTIGRGEVELRDVKFRYPGAPSDALGGINLLIRPGERVGLIGRVASGKSTLGRVVCGLYAPTDGAMLIDGVDSRQYHPHEIRRAFRYVGQESDLFSGTIRDNLLLGARQADDEQLLRAVHATGADAFLVRDAAGFDMPVGERGGRLSGGQRQFLAVSRALVEPGALLYLDEPTGSMDVNSEQLFIQRLGAALKPDQSLVVSTHRLAMLQLVDRVIVMDRGRIVADGPKAEIMARAAPLSSEPPRERPVEQAKSAPARAKPAGRSRSAGAG